MGANTASRLEHVEIEIFCQDSSDYAALGNLFFNLVLGGQTIFRVRLRDMEIRLHPVPTYRERVNLPVPEKILVMIGLTPRFPEPGPAGNIQLQPYFIIDGRRLKGTPARITAGARHAADIVGEDIVL